MNESLENKAREYNITCVEIDYEKIYLTIHDIKKTKKFFNINYSTKFFTKNIRFFLLLFYDKNNK